MSESNTSLQQAGIPSADRPTIIVASDRLEKQKREKIIAEAEEKLKHHTDELNANRQSFTDDQKVTAIEDINDIRADLARASNPLTLAQQEKEFQLKTQGSIDHQSNVYKSEAKPLSFLERLKSLIKGNDKDATVQQVAPNAVSQGSKPVSQETYDALKKPIQPLTPASDGSAK